MALQCGAKSAWRHLFTIKSAVIGAARPQAVRSVYELTPHPMDDRSYEAALRILSSLIAFKSRAEGKGWRDAFENMEVYADRVGLGGGKLDELSVIHVAGTKGKGSTCAMVESILRSCGYKTGLYTSPHLVDVRERIRIDGSLVSRDAFLSCFWDCHDKLTSAATPEVGVPGYFRFLTLLALRVFAAEAVDVAVLEVGLGGRLDATNVVRRPLVCGITPLGYDHMDMLGDTLTLIGREKAGILKKGRPAFTAPQPDEGMAALLDVAAQKGVELRSPPPLGAYRPEAGSPPLALGLQGEHQRMNAALAVQLAATWEEERLAQLGASADASAAACAPAAAAAAETGAAAVATTTATSASTMIGSPGSLTPAALAAARRRLELLRRGELPWEYVQGLAAVRWPGRSQVFADPEFADCSSGSSSGSSSDGCSSSRLTFYLDGAHTIESMVVCGTWFTQMVAGAAAGGAAAAATGKQQQRELNVLVFNCAKEREPASLLPSLAAALAAGGTRISHAVFVPPESSYGFLLGSKDGGAAPAEPLREKVEAVDISFQRHAQGVWSSAAAWGAAARGSSAPASALPPVPALPQLGMAQPADAAGGGAVVPSLAHVVSWLKQCARNDSSLRLRVLVTGSLYLVGDVLRMLGRVPS